MMAAVSGRGLGLALFSLLLGCAGNGSDIGPRLSRLPNASTKVLVLDDQNRGVVSAKVAVVGTSWRATTGRNGRGDFLANPTGRRLYEVDARYAAATAGDFLVKYRVALTVDGDDLPMPLHVPEIPSASAGVFSTGAQGATGTVTSSSGATLTIASGTLVEWDGESQGATARIGLGELAPQHLPGDLPSGATGTRLFGRGYFIGPYGLRFTPGIDLDVPDDLNVTTPAAQLFWLDADTGEWMPVATAGANSGRLQALGSITRSGLYAWGVSTEARTVSGRIVDPNGEPVRGALVRVDHLYATAANDGSFQVDLVPARLGDGSTRSALVEVYAGGFWLPTVTTTTAGYDAAPVDLGDLALDTLVAGNVRVQQVVRARADPFQPARLSSVFGEVALFTTSDALGQAVFEDVPTGYFGSQEARRRNYSLVYYGQSLGFLPAAQRWLDSYQFLSERPWFVGTRGGRGYVCDAVGGGPIFGAAVVQGEIVAEGYIGETRENGLLFADRGWARRATATLKTERDGRSITHAYTYELPSSDHLEFPMRRVLRTPLGAFDRHALVMGRIANPTPGAQHGLRVARRLSRQEWWDDVVDGVPIQSTLPIDVDPANTHDAFQCGAPLAGGNLALVEYDQPGGRNRLRQVLVYPDVHVGAIEGELGDLGSLALLPADGTFLLDEVLAGAPDEVDANALDLALAVDLPDAGVAEVFRDLAGSLTSAGNDLQIGLPRLLGGALAGAKWLALVRGSTTVAGVTSSHASLFELDEDVESGLSFQPFPTLTSPAPNEAVPAAGFEVKFSLPAGALGGFVELRSETSGELLLWQVRVRPDQPDFTFVALPSEASTPLVAGRTYTLTVTAYFGDVDIPSPDPYGDFTSFAQSLGLVEVGVTQYTQRSVTITTL
ncbi:MAG TPA: carboxypeptidase regulatory-like domain-containing protein [bacterium]|nr:carboxypeptidase regulatory-like domain-containing protein [bacterium]